jgi:hypothetical protein
MSHLSKSIDGVQLIKNFSAGVKFLKTRLVAEVHAIDHFGRCPLGEVAEKFYFVSDQKTEIFLTPVSQ